MIFKITSLALLVLLTIAYPVPDGNSHLFDFDGPNFTLDGQPFKFVACEIHYPRIPKQYWEHRIQMSKALGCNVISAYVFWNYHEETEGVFDFETEERDLSAFLDLIQKNQMWVFIRPGPYVCAEWDAGGHPWWLLAKDVKLRTTDPVYVNAVKNYVAQLDKLLFRHQVHEGGNILLLQIENEYGYNVYDLQWLLQLREIWEATSLKLKFYAAEPVSGLASTHQKGVAIGINPGVSESYFEIARRVDKNVPVFSSETWLGWFTHWGDADWGVSTVQQSVQQVSFLISHNYSFSIYMAHGGTSFGFWPGANYDNGYQPDISSYDYDAAINEAGDVTQRFAALRPLIQQFASWDVPEVPEHVGYIEIPEFTLKQTHNLISAVTKVTQQERPLSMEQIGQQHGFIVYESQVSDISKGDVLKATIHDYAQIYVNGLYQGTIDRRLKQDSFEFKNEFKQPLNNLTIVVEGHGRINFGDQILDRKGLIGSVFLKKGLLKEIEILNWVQMSIPLKDLSFADSIQESFIQAGFYQGTFEIDQVGDTYLDLTKCGKGYVWVNGRNIGRYWEIGPQKRLYLPGAFLQQGTNAITVLDLQSSDSVLVKGVKSMR